MSVFISYLARIYRCEASSMELAPRNKELYKNLYKNEFPSIKVSPFDAELNSASNGDTCIHGKMIEKISSRIFFFHTYTYRRKIKI
jgi:hypothetical protein